MSDEYRGRQLPPWSWHGVVAAVLSLTLGGGYAAVLVIEALQAQPVRGELLQFLTNLGSILAGALAGWLGGSAVADDQRRTTAAEPSVVVNTAPPAGGSSSSTSSSTSSSGGDA